ncbi:hypothetical protein K8942_04655 [Candidatus Peribacteria bacterium]|nr:MAG: hypothetical protein K8942_04655 [Candidatus Peribacteria bacterium]
MSIFLSICGIILSIFMLKYRERIGDFMGEADWMRYTGGVYNFVILLAIFIFLWSLATMTGTTDALFMPFLYLLPGGVNPGAQSGMAPIQ